jgi:hypothetical protein
MKNKSILLLALFVPIILSAQQSQEEPSFELRVDPKIELASIVLNYAYWDYYGKFRTPDYTYYNNMKAHFDRYQDHSTIQWFDSVSTNWNLGDPVYVVLWYDSLPMKQTVPFPLHPTSQIDTIMVREYISRLNDFAEDSDFEGYWEGNKPWHDSVIQKLSETADYAAYMKILEDFYGDRKEQYTFLLAPLFNGVSFGPQVPDGDHTTAYFISGFDAMDNGTPYFNPAYLRMLIFHEFGHSFVNPVCEKYRQQLYEYESLSQYLNSPFLSNYASWFAFCHEHIVRASESILLEKAGFHEEAKKNYDRNLELGFALLPFFTEKLQYYDVHREEYPNFEAFFPELLTVFSETEPVETEEPNQYEFRKKQ